MIAIIQPYPLSSSNESFCYSIWNTRIEYLEWIFTSDFEWYL